MADEPAFRGPYDHDHRGRPYFDAPAPVPEVVMAGHITVEQFDAALAVATQPAPEPEPE